MAAAAARDALGGKVDGAGVSMDALAAVSLAYAYARAIDLIP